MPPTEVGGQSGSRVAEEVRGATVGRGWNEQRVADESMFVTLQRVLAGS